MKKGDEVRCINGYFEDEESNPFRISELNLPEEGELYTIRQVVTTGYGNGVRLVEIINKEYYFENIRKREEPIFNINRFQLPK